MQLRAKKMSIKIFIAIFVDFAVKGPHKCAWL